MKKQLTREAMANRIVVVILPNDADFYHSWDFPQDQTKCEKRVKRQDELLNVFVNDVKARNFNPCEVCFPGQIEVAK